MTIKEIIEQSTDEEFREYLRKMPVGKGITLPVAGYVRHILMQMFPIERENMGPKIFARQILVFRTVAEQQGSGEKTFEVVHEVLDTTTDLTDSNFDVNHFMRQVKDHL